MAGQLAVRSILAPLELWRPALVEGTHAFQAVVAMDGAVIGLNRQHHACFQVSFSAPDDGFLGLPYGNGAILGDGGGNLQSFVIGLAGWYKVIDQADGLGFLCRHTAPGENHFLGERRPDDAWQELCATNTGKNAPRHFWHGKHRRLAGYHKIRQYSQFTATAHSKTFDRRNDGLGAAQDPQRRLLKDDVLLAPSIVRHAL